VVGISQNQALAYCKWLQDKYNAELAISDKYKDYICLVSLPTDKEWESAFYYTYQKAEKNPFWAPYIILKNVNVPKKKQAINYGQDITKEHFVIRDYITDGGLYPLGYNRFKPAKN